MANSKSRIWELDALRGVCILCVIVVHVLFDLSFFGGINLTLPAWSVFLRAYGGALFVQIENLPDEIFAPLDSTSFMRQYLEIISSFYCDHRLLAAGFLYQNGTEFSENGGEIEAFFPDRTLVFSFESAEGLCRVYNISSK